MSGPYRKCRSCNGPGEMCDDCPLEGDPDDTDDQCEKVLAAWVPLGYGADMTRQVSSTESTNQAPEGPTGPGGRNAPRLAPVGPSGVEVRQ